MSDLKKNLDRQRSRLVALGGILLTAMCVTLVLVSFGGASEGISFERRWSTLVGLLGLVLLFVLFAQQKHRELLKMESKLRDMAVREASMQARFSEMTFLFDISTQLQLRLDLQGMLDLAVQRLLPALDAHECSIMLYNEETGMLATRAVAGADSGLVTGAEVKPGEGVAGYVFESGETLILTPEMVKQRFPDSAKPSRNIVSGLCVPMRFRGEPIGVVGVTRNSGDAFADIHARMLAAFAEHCAATVVKTNHHHELLASVRRAA